MTANDSVDCVSGETSALSNSALTSILILTSMQTSSPGFVFSSLDWATSVLADDGRTETFYAFQEHRVFDQRHRR